MIHFQSMSHTTVVLPTDSNAASIPTANTQQCPMVKAASRQALFSTAKQSQTWSAEETDSTSKKLVCRSPHPKFTFTWVTER